MSLHPLVLLCVAAILASIALGVKEWWFERRHLRELQEDLDAVARDERARAVRRTLGRPRG